MKPRHLLTLRDLKAPEVLALFKEAARLKRLGKPAPGSSAEPSTHRPLSGIKQVGTGVNRGTLSGVERGPRVGADRGARAGASRASPAEENRLPLAGKVLGLLFQKPSVRTRVSFEVGVSQLGGESLYIGPVELEQGKRESPKDLARVLSRYLEGIVARTFAHREVEELARWATIPVINGLSNEHHPCQALSDLFTVYEQRELKGVRMAFVGDGNNVCHSLLEACALLGVDLTLATPANYRPHPEIVQWALAQAKRSGAQISLARDPREAVKGASFVYTDVWASMGQEGQRPLRRRIFRGYQVNASLMRRAGKGAFFMHCLPAHRGEEVTDAVIDGPRSLVYAQAENRLHVQKAILEFLLDGKTV